MKTYHFLLSLALAGSVTGSIAGAQQPVPEIPFESNVNFLRIPPTLHFGEVAGVAVNSKRHLFLFVRTGERSTVHGASAAQLFEFDPTGAYVREIGKDLYGFSFAHTVRIDKDDNIWTTDEGTNMIVKFSPAGRVLLVLGRRAESVEPVVEPAPGAPPPRAGWGTFNRPTDVAWDPAGNIFIADGYTNSRVVKVDKNGRWVKSWGQRGTEPGMFNILHTIASDAKGNVYVGDRSNRRIQVFDSDGTFLRQFTIDVPFTKEVNVLVGAVPGPNSNPLSVSGAPWAICITPTATQYLYVADAVPGRIYKLTLDGKVVGVFGEAGKQPKQFGWVHEIACPTENELYVAELLNWRMQKLTLNPGEANTMTTLSRRDFTRFLALSGSASFLPTRAFANEAPSLDELGLTSAPLPPTPRIPDEKFWVEVRSRFLVPRDVGFMNAANLCPMSLPVLEAIEKNARSYELGPTPEARTVLMRAREDSRKMIAEALRVTPEEIVLVRNTTEGNNFVSSGLTLGAGDEVIVSSDNHPSNLNAWRQKATRFGFTVVTVTPPAAHPGTQGYVDLFVKAFTPRTKVLAVTYVSSNSGDVLPVAELCQAARERNVLSLVDGAQAFGVIDVNLGAIKPDFFTGSMHKWPCGPKEKGVLFVNRAVQDRLAPSVVGVYGGAVGIARTFEAEGQRDDASIAAITEALRFQGAIGRDVIEQRSRALAQHMMAELSKLDGVHLWTDRTPDRSAAIVIFKPGTLDPRKLTDALAAKERIIVTARNANGSNPGLRASPHFYNTMSEIDRFVGAIGGYLKSGV